TVSPCRTLPGASSAAQAAEASNRTSAPRASIARRPLRAIDHDGFDQSLLRIQFQSKLLLQCREQRWPRRIGNRKSCCRGLVAVRLGHLRIPVELELVGPREAGLIEHRTP